LLGGKTHFLRATPFARTGSGDGLPQGFGKRCLQIRKWLGQRRMAADHDIIMPRASIVRREPYGFPQPPADAISLDRLLGRSFRHGEGSASKTNARRAVL
jgi:hypothetical protein